VVENAFELMITWVVVETSIVQMSLFDFNWASFITHHEFLEGQETIVPTITFSIGYKLRHCRWRIEHWSNLKLPNASINLTESIEWSPIFQMLWLVCWQRILPNVCNHISIVYWVVYELGLVVSVEQVEQFGPLPNSISSQDVVLFVLVPIYISNREVVTLWHFKWSSRLRDSCCFLLIR